MEDYRKLVGYIPSPVVNISSFATPIYQNIDKSCFEIQKVEEAMYYITGFDQISDTEPLQMVELPEFLERIDVKVGDSPFFVITMNALLFVGTADELSPHIEGIKKMSGDNFIEELELISLKK